MGILSLTNMFRWNENHAPKKTTITSTYFDPWKDIPNWSEEFSQYTLPRKNYIKVFIGEDQYEKVFYSL